MATETKEVPTEHDPDAEALKEFGRMLERAISENRSGIREKLRRWVAP